MNILTKKKKREWLTAKKYTLFSEYSPLPLQLYQQPAKPTANPNKVKPNEYDLFSFLALSGRIIVEFHC